MEETRASKFCRMMRTHSSFRVGPTEKTTIWSIFQTVPAHVRGSNFGTRLLQAMSAGTSNTLKNSWASKRKPFLKQHEDYEHI
jgi:hypothetical protein